MSYLGNVGKAVGDGVAGAGESIGDIIGKVFGAGSGGSSDRAIQGPLERKRACEAQGGTWDGDTCVFVTGSKKGLLEDRDAKARADQARGYTELEQ